MKAIVYRRYGSPEVLHFEEVARPVPGDDEVLVKVYAVSLNAGDVHLLTADSLVVRLSMGMSRPKHPILGSDIAGRVEAVGHNVTRLKPGDAVYGDLSKHRLGGFAEYALGTEKYLTLMPAGMTFVQAAAVPMAAVTALQALRDQGRLQPGHNVLINGASGGVGTFAVQLAKAMGANVTAVCSTRNLEMVRRLGAVAAIDYTREDFAGNGRQYDLILGVGGHRSLGEYKRSLAPGGRYVMVGGAYSQIFEAFLLGPVRSIGGSRKLGGFEARPNVADLDALRGLLEAGTIAPVIDRCWPLEQVADAFRYLIDEHARGKVVITVTEGAS